ncbi:MAG: hypothetical protein JWO65_2607, partial [Sphingomonas bacterium]|nr:hypothetical protein [Sphingomonas bacterium]
MSERDGATYLAARVISDSAGPDGAISNELINFSLAVANLRENLLAVVSGLWGLPGLARSDAEPG